MAASQRLVPRDLEGVRLAGRIRAACLVLVVLLLGCSARQPPVVSGPLSTRQPLSPEERLASDIRTLIEGPGVQRATWGIVIHSLARNERLFELNPRALLVPGSTAKLVSLAAAVDAVGWDYRFETVLGAAGPIVDGVLRGDLWVIGSGDPTIEGRGGDDLTSWIDALTRAGIRRIDGRVIGDDEALDEARPGAVWAWEDLGYPTGVLFGALNLGENRMVVTVAPGSASGTPTAITVDPIASSRPLVNRSSTGPAGSRSLLWAEQRPGETALTIAGSIPVGSPPSALAISVGNPTQWFVNVFRSRLVSAGIEVRGAALDVDDLAGVSRPPVDVLFSYRSRPLADIAQPLMKNSINLYGEAVLRLAAGTHPARTNDEALEAIRQRVSAWGQPPDAVQVVDGSGLSRRDAVATETLVAILRHMYDESGTSPWMRALPVAGRDGTLSGRMKGTAAEANVMAKTGTLSNVRSLAGYVRTADREPLAFAIVVNNFEGSPAEALAAIDAIAIKLALFVRQR